MGITISICINVGAVPQGKSAENHGATIIELLLAFMVLSIACIALLRAGQSGLAAITDCSEQARAQAMGRELYEEIVALPRGRMIAGSAHCRTYFATLLDYNGLDESPPRDPLGEPIAGLEEWRRMARVRFVSPERIQDEVPTGASDLVEVAIEVSHRGEVLYRTSFLRCLQ